MRKQSAYWLIGILIIVFFGPMLTAWMIYKIHPQWLNHTNNKGFLIKPPLDFSNLTIQANNGEKLAQTPAQGKWILLWVSPQPCETSCQENIFKIRQTYLSFLLKDRQRIERIWLTYTPVTDPKLLQALHTHYEGTQQFIIAQNQFANFVRYLPNSDKIVTKGELFIVDPHGNILLSYAPDANPKYILKDLTKLLKVSKIG